MNGLQVAAELREKLHRQVPVIILTGDISTGTLREIALHDCVQLNKPVKLKELTEVIQRLLATPHAAPTVRRRALPKRRPSAAARHLRRRRRQPHPRGDSRGARRRRPDRRGPMRPAKPFSKPIIPAGRPASWSTPICRG